MAAVTILQVHSTVQGSLRVYYYRFSTAASLDTLVVPLHKLMDFSTLNRKIITDVIPTRVPGGTQLAIETSPPGPHSDLQISVVGY